MGSILEMYVTISCSLLYRYPQTFRSKTMVRANTNPTDKAMYMTTRVASFAASGWPAPSSFETRVLRTRKRARISWVDKQDYTGLIKIQTVPHIWWDIIMLLIGFRIGLLCWGITTDLIEEERPSGTMYSSAPVLRLQTGATKYSTEMEPYI